MWNRAARGSVVGALVSVVALTLVHVVRPGMRLDFAEDHAPPPVVTVGFSAPSSLDGHTGVWTSTRGDLRLRGIDRRAAWQVRARLRAPGSRAPRGLAVEADARALTTVVVPSQWIEVTAVVPASPDRTALVLSLHTLDEGDTGGRSGVFVDWIEIAPTGWSFPPRSALWTAGIAGALLGVALAGWGLVSGFPLVCAVGAVGLVEAIPLLRGLGPFSILPGTTAAVDVLVGASIAAGSFIWRLLTQRTASTTTRWALVATAVATHLTVLVLVHPGVTHGDSGFHAHRFSDVQGGHWFFTSSGPGGEFPYAVGLYVFALPWRAMHGDAATLLRLVVVLATAGAGLLVYAAAARWWSPRAGLVALVLAHALPQNLNVQGTAFLTNAFGNALAAAAVSALALAASRPSAGQRWALVGFGATLALGAALSHVSSAVLLLTTLGTSALLLIAHGPRHRLLGLQTLLVLVLVSVCAWGLYYRRFGDVYQGLLSKPSPDVVATEPPQMRTEAHQTRYVPGTAAQLVRAAAVPRYAVRYYGVAGIALGAIGLLLAIGRRSDPLAVIAIGWALTCVAFLTLGVLSPVDLRYYLAGFPLVALLSGLAAADWSHRGGLRRSLASMLLVWALAEGAWSWWRWLGTPDL